ncbi:MAG: D-alanyl-D-alanine carboxypeptidase [Lachnospiraceae bacterium]|nr:D-alanyl-D-alanine carboxypeptidase [Lachnospiraceae bacterium]MBR4278526.1 D-alanyl-D-alanine carboxypeptidase [Lachnospiraceae bacterium]
MRCINKAKALQYRFIAGLLSVICILSVCGCAQIPYSSEYGSLNMGAISDKASVEDRADAFASSLCVTTNDLVGDGAIDLDSCESAVLFDINNKEVVYSKNALETLYPASLTKIMTALVAIKHGKMDQVLTATNAVNIKETGAQLAGIVAGDSMTLYQALRMLLLYSANDVALLIAENIGGSVDGFVAMMNEEAINLGATGTHFTNPHGLSNPEHYTTAYDLYLIFNECIKYEEFTQIISLQTFDATYTNKNGKEVVLSVKNTNAYINGTLNPPANVTVIGGKTGTTTAAGHCLILLSKDVNGSPFISVILKSDGTDSLYKNMNTLLEQIGT